MSNIGPDIAYRPNLPEETGASVPLPTTARLGLAWTFFENRSARLRVMPELTKVLVGMPADTADKGLCQQSGEEWKDVWKAVGIEATAFNIVSLRIGYFEDVNSKRGGIVLRNLDGETYHYGVWDALTGKHLGSVERIGLCWGFGLGTNKLRFDLSSDAAIYDFPTENWKVSLVANDIAGGIRELRQGHVPWEE